MAWHLSESQRVFGELALPDELADAARLERWLIEHGARERTLLIPKNHVLQHGPLRKVAALDEAAIRLDQIRALAGLLSLEEVAAEFARLELLAQIAIFGLFEGALGDARAALMQRTGVEP